jgi:hypothetical protein
VIASGFVKLVFNNVMTACRSAGLSELTRSPVVGLADGEGDADTAGFAGAAGLPGGAPIGGVCPGAPVARRIPIKSREMNGCIENEMPTYNAFSNSAKIRNPDNFSMLRAKSSNPESDVAMLQGSRG